MIQVNNVQPNELFVNEAYPAENIDQPIVLNNLTSMTGGGYIDISGGPVTLEIPEVKDRFVVYQFIDVFTHNFFYSGTITDGGEGGRYILYNNTQEVPDDPTATPVLMEGDLAILSCRMDIKDRSELDKVLGLLNQMKIPDAPSTNREYPEYSKDKAFSPDFVEYIDALLYEVPSGEEALFKRFTRIGVMNEIELSASETKEVQAGIDSAFAAIKASTKDAMIGNNWIGFTEMFGNREFLNDDYMKRALGAHMGLWGNSKEQAIYFALETNGSGKLTFTSDNFPPLTDIGFWSVTAYDGDYYIMPNEYDAYVLTMDKMKIAEDGSLTITFSPTPQDGNWLYTSGDDLVILLRAYAADPDKISNYIPPKFQSLKTE